MNIFLLQQLVTPEVNIPLLLPEIFVAVAAIIIMLVDSFAVKDKMVTGGIAFVGLGLATVSTIMLWTSGSASASLDWNGMLAFDALRMSFTLIFLLVAAMTILISSVWTETEEVPTGEYHALLLFATVGMMLMASGNDLVIIFLGLETLSIATYVLCGLRRTDMRSNESALKYFILGSFSSGFLLYGMALIYGATGGQTNIEKIAQNVDNSQFPVLLLIGAAMLLIGFGFKVASAPFHVWTPDVYQGAPTPITAFMAAGPKAAGFASFLRVFILGFPIVSAVTTNPSFQLNQAWLSALTVMAILSMTIGNLAAIVQNNIKRMLAYSSIAHAGYILVGFVGAGAATTLEKRETAIAAVAFYMLGYAVSTLGAFAVVTLLAQKGDKRTDFDDYNGIGFKSPFLAFSLSLFMLSFMGLPLTAGFMGKIGVFKPAADAGYYLLVIFAVINSAISVYYYLRVVVVMFFRERMTEWFEPKMPVGIAIVLIVAVFGTLYLGLMPNSVIEAFRKTPTMTVDKVSK